MTVPQHTSGLSTTGLSVPGAPETYTYTAPTVVLTWQQLAARLKIPGAMFMPHERLPRNMLSDAEYHAITNSAFPLPIPQQPSGAHNVTSHRTSNNNTPSSPPHIDSAPHMPNNHGPPSTDGIILNNLGVEFVGNPTSRKAMVWRLSGALGWPVSVVNTAWPYDPTARSLLPTVARALERQQSGELQPPFGPQTRGSIATMARTTSPQGASSSTAPSYRANTPRTTGYTEHSRPTPTSYVGQRGPEAGYPEWTRTGVQTSHTPGPTSTPARTEMTTTPSVPPPPTPLPHNQNFSGRTNSAAVNSTSETTTAGYGVHSNSPPAGPQVAHRGFQSLKRNRLSNDKTSCRMPTQPPALRPSGPGAAPIPRDSTAIGAERRRHQAVVR